MAKKKPTRIPPAPVVVEATAPPTPANVLLDWRFNLVVLGCMEVLLILFALPREIERFRVAEAQKALWRADRMFLRGLSSNLSERERETMRTGYLRAYGLYYKLERNDRNNPGHLRALGDASLGRGQYAVALEYYRRATEGRYNSPEVKLQVARIYSIMANQEKDPKRQKDYIEASQKLLQLAYQEGPNNLKVNFWLGYYAASNGDLIEAAELFSRVRKDMVPSGKPNEEEASLIAEAKDTLAQIQTAIFKGADFRLDLTGVKIPTIPPAPAPVGLTTAPVITPPLSKPTSSAVMPLAPIRTEATAGPAAAQSPTIRLTPMPPRPTPMATPARVPGATTPTAAIRPPVPKPMPTVPPAIAGPTTSPGVRVDLIPTTGPGGGVPAKP